MKYYRLTKDVPNSKHDRRYRYGIESVETFETGWLVREHEEDGRTRYDIKLKYWQSLGHEDRNAFVPHLEPVTLQDMSLEEIAAMEWTPYDIFCEVAIEILVKEGKITKEEVLAAFQRSDDETES